MSKSIPCLMVFFNQEASEQDYQASKARALDVAGVKVLDIEDKGRIMSMCKTRTQDADRALLKQVEAVSGASACYGSINSNVVIKYFAKKKQERKPA